MEFELLTPLGTEFKGEATEVTLGLSGGQAGILLHHEPLIDIAVAGPVEVRVKGGKRELFTIAGGLLEVSERGVRLLADTPPTEDTVQTAAREAVAAAQKLQAGVKEKHHLARAHELVDRRGLRLGVSGLRRRRRQRHG